MGSAVGYLLLDTTGFKDGLKGAINQLKVFSNEQASISDKLTGLGSAFTGAGKTLTKNLTTPLVGLGTVAVNTTATFDSSMSKVQAISGAVGDDFDRLREKAKEMGAKTKFSASEAADAFTYMAMAGWKTEDMLDGIEGIMSLAAASGEDLAATSDIVTDALTAFGLTAKDSAHFADVLAAASNSANTNVSMLGESFKYVAPVAGALGYTAEDTSIALGLMANSGIKASQAGTALRTILTNMADPTDTVASAMEILNVSLTDSEGNMKSLREIMEDLKVGFGNLSEAESAQVASMLAGKEGMSGLLAIVNSSETDFNKLAEAIDNADGTAENMANTMLDNLNGQLTILKSALEGAAIAFGDLLMPLIRDLVSLLQGAVDWVNNLTEAQKETIVRIAEVAAVVGPVLLILGKVVKSITSIISIVNKAKTVILAIKPVITALMATLKANPIGLVITAIAALVAAFTYLWNNCESFRQFWINLWEGIKSTFSSVVEWFNTTIASISAWFESIPERIQAVFQSIGDWFSGIWTSITTWFTELPGKVWNWLTNTAQSIIDWLTSLPETVAYWLGYLAGSVVQWGIDLYDSITQWSTETYENISNWVTTTIQNIVTWVSELPGRIWNWLVETYNQIKQWGIDTYTSIKNWMVNTLNSVSTWLSELPGRVWNWLLNTLGRIKQWGSDTYSSAKQIISDFINRISTGLSELPGKFREWFNQAISYLSTLPSRMWQIGRDIFNGLWDGLKSIWSNIKSWIEGVKEKIASIFSSAKQGYKDATAAASSTRSSRSEGSYASGLDYVPRDMYVKVHEGERILTKQESKNQITNQPQQQTVKQPVNIVMQVDGRELGYVAIDNINTITETDGTVKLKV